MIFLNTEIEARLLDINKDELIKKLEELGAQKVADFEQKRYIYDFNPIKEHKWIRLRTNGTKTSLTIKEIKSDKIDGTKELEIEVNDFNKTNLILNELGYTHRAYQENKRTRYMYEGIEIDIDTWPLIPTYVELEGNDEKSIIDFVEKLGYKKEEIVTYGVSKIYEHYDINIDDYKDLTF